MRSRILLGAMLALGAGAHLTLAAAGPTAGDAAPREPLGVCQVMEGVETYRDRTVTMEGYLTSDSHGLHLLEPGCGYEINLMWSDDVRLPREFRRVADRIWRKPMMVRVRARGMVKDEKFEGDVSEDSLMALLGTRLELAEVEVLSAERLSRRDEARFQDWLDSPNGRAFRPGRD